MPAPSRNLVARLVPLALLAFFSTPVRSPAASTGNSCIECHSTMDAYFPIPRRRSAQDVHMQRGLSCADCHGGDPTQGWAEQNPKLAHNAAHGWRGVPKGSDIPDFCARCHSDVEFMKKYNPKLRVDQLLEYRSSRHGKLLAEGDTKVAQCASCHSVHGILPVSDSRSPVHRTNIPATCGHCHADPAYMRGYGIPTDQLAQYTNSVHGTLLLAEGNTAAPACNDCHGNHGATPPGLTSIANACGECHAINRDFFNESLHKSAFAEAGLAECTTCHGNHDTKKTNDDMLGVGASSLCVACHDNDAGYQAAQLMRAQLDSLKTMIDSARRLLTRAEQGGVNVKRGRFDLQSPMSALVKARGAVHYFSPEKLAAIVEPGIQEAGIVTVMAEEALDDLNMRRLGLAFSLPLIILLALGLYLKTRRMEVRTRTQQ